jgi:hypothetical protein
MSRTKAPAGFNKGFGNVAFLPFDAVDQVRNYLTGRHGTSPHELFNKVAVDPAAEPQSISQSLARSGGQGVGGAAIPMAGMLGAAGSGLRSGVTLAERAAAPGLDTVQAPSVGGILGKLKDCANAADPRNIMNAFRPTNMQATADRVLDDARYLTEPNFARSIILKPVRASFTVKSTMRAGILQREQWILDQVQLVAPSDESTGAQP